MALLKDQATKWVMFCINVSWIVDAEWRATNPPKTLVHHGFLAYRSPSPDM